MIRCESAETADLKQIENRWKTLPGSYTICLDAVPKGYGITETWHYRTQGSAAQLGESGNGLCQGR